MRSIHGATEMRIAWDVRRSSRTAQPNSRIVSIADRVLKRDGPHDPCNRRYRPRRCSNRRPPVPARFALTHRARAAAIQNSFSAKVTLPRLSSIRGRAMAEVVVVGLLILAIPVISIVALVMTLNARDGVRRLEHRVAGAGGNARRSAKCCSNCRACSAAPVQAAEPPPVVVEPVAAPEIPAGRARRPCRRRAPTTLPSNTLIPPVWLVFGVLLLIVGFPAAIAAPARLPPPRLSR